MVSIPPIKTVMTGGLVYYCFTHIWKKTWTVKRLKSSNGDLTPRIDSIVGTRELVVGGSSFLPQPCWDVGGHLRRGWLHHGFLQCYVCSLCIFCVRNRMCRCWIIYLKVEYSRTSPCSKNLCWIDGLALKGIFLLFDSWLRGESLFPLMFFFVRQIKTAQKNPTNPTKGLHPHDIHLYH
jgi:hypothetical protein